MEIKIAIIGFGYVGLPLARLFSTKFKTMGFDMNQSRVDALMKGHDATLEVADELLQEAIEKNGFVCTTDLEEIRDCNFYVVAVPTPVDENNRPDLKPLWSASGTVGKVISKGDVVVYEIVDVYHTLQEYTNNITVFDPWADAQTEKRHYDFDITQGDMQQLENKYDAVIHAVTHKEFADVNVRKFLKNDNGVVYDVKGLFDRDLIEI